MWLFPIAKEAAWKVDLWLFHLINGCCGSWVLDWGASFIERTDLLTGGLLMAGYWWVWFKPEQRADSRQKLIEAILASVIALIIARAIAKGLPFRVRPLYTPGIDYRAPQLPSGSIIGGYEHWSAFPSDHAALFFALAAGMWRCSRIAGSVTFIVAAVGIGAVRVYLGIHYPSDVLTGAAIGIVCVYALGRIGLGALTGPIAEFEWEHPSAFYALAFVITYELASVFGDIRLLLHGLLRLFQRIGVHSLDLTGVVFLVVGSLVPLALVAWLLMRWAIKRRRTCGPQKRDRPAL